MATQKRASRENTPLMTAERTVGSVISRPNTPTSVASPATPASAWNLSLRIRSLKCIVTSSYLLQSLKTFSKEYPGAAGFVPSGPVLILFVVDRFYQTNILGGPSLTL